ncbi:MAG: C69 family dipeptidase [Fretibacterium sp.]|nr:C69 family dipeptidase [Fretibacterium sp.]
MLGTRCNALCRVFSAVLCLSIFSTPVLACTDVVVGKDASVDGSVMTCHTADGAYYDAQIRFIPGQKFPAGSMTPVYRNMTMEEPGGWIKAGEIPQAEETYGYFHVGYPAMNEHRVAIGETTIGQKEILKSIPGAGKALLTIEQLEVLALQRAKTAREAIRVMGDLSQKYGFMPSCGTEGECLTVTDPDEAWIFHVFGTGFAWTPESGKPGSVWAAQRVPDDEVVVVPNIARIRFIDPKDTRNFMVSDNYMQHAIDNGLYDPKSGEPFDFQAAYTPATGNDDWALSSMWVRNRLYTIHKALAPSREWDPYAPVSSYPFSIKPEKKLSVRDIMGFIRSYHKGSVFDMTLDPMWTVRGKDGSAELSPLTTPFPTRLQRDLLKIPYSRSIATNACAYSWVSQMRKDLPEPVGGVLWFGYDNPAHTLYVPVYTGTRDTKESWKSNFDRDKFSADCAQWAFMLQDDVVNWRYQEAIKDLEAVRNPIEDEFFKNQAEVEKKASALYKEDPAKATKFLTDYTIECMDKAEKAYWNLNATSIAKYTNNR